MPKGTYEEWIKFLTAWTADPSMPIAELPSLTEDTFSPSTFARLVKHINRANDALMDRWKNELQTGMARAASTYEVEMVLIRSRGLLAKRLCFAQQAALPQKLQKALLDSAKADIESLQAQLEENASTRSSRSSINGNGLLEAIKRSPLTAILQDDYSDQNRMMKVIDAAESFNMEEAHEQGSRTADVQGHAASGRFRDGQPHINSILARFRKRK